MSLLTRLLILLALAVLLAWSGLVHAARVADGASARLRAGASAKGAVLAVLPPGTPVEMLEEKTDYVRVVAAGKKGWVAKRLLAMNAAPARVAAAKARPAQERRAAPRRPAPAAVAQPPQPQAATAATAVPVAAAAVAVPAAPVAAAAAPIAAAVAAPAVAAPAAAAGEMPSRRDEFALVREEQEKNTWRMIGTTAGVALASFLTGFWLRGVIFRQRYGWLGKGNRSPRRETS